VTDSNRPGWAQPTPGEPAARTRPRLEGKARSDAIKGCSCFTVVIAGVVIGAVALISGGGSKAASAAATVAAAPTTSDDGVANPVELPPTPTTAAIVPPTVSSKPSPSFVMPSIRSYLAPGSIRRHAAAILHADDAYYQNEYNQGVTVVLNRGSTNSYPAFGAWYNKAVTSDPQPGITAFKQVNSMFNGNDEPSAVSDWEADNVSVSSDLATLANDGLGVGGPGDAQARQQVLADEKQFQADFDAVEQDADNVAAGK